MGADPEQLASAAVVRLLGRPSEYDAYSRLESAEVVLLRQAAGIAMTWTQDDVEGGQRRFGLLMTVEELQHAPHGVPTPAGVTYPFESWVADLELAVVEPHEGDASGVRRTWFRTLP